MSEEEKVTARVELTRRAGEWVAARKLRDLSTGKREFLAVPRQAAAMGCGHSKRQPRQEAPDFGVQAFS